MAHIETPHMAYPFTLGADHNVVEQDSDDDVANCVRAILLYRVGYRTLNPEFGISDPVFAQGGPNLDEISAAIEEFEPRAGAVIEDLSEQLRQAGSLEEAVSTIRIALEG